MLGVFFVESENGDVFVKKVENGGCFVKKSGKWVFL